MSRTSFIRDERGFSLMELLMAMALGSVVLTATMLVFTTGITATGRITDRTDSSARARAAMDRITTLLDSQVCLRNNGDSTTQAAIPPVDGAASNGNSITFYADLSGASNTPNKYTITYASGVLTLNTYAGTGVLPNVTFAATPKVSQLATNVAPAVVGGVAQPIFTYFQFATDGSVNPTTPVTPSAANQLLIIREAVQFQASSNKNATDAARTTISGEAIVATADPTEDDLNACA
jgi:prepilin-type N-terminal cleavage/methylation domain-containing protein